MWMFTHIFLRLSTFKFNLCVKLFSRSDWNIRVVLNCISPGCYIISICHPICEFSKIPCAFFLICTSYNFNVILFDMWNLEKGYEYDYFHPYSIHRNWTWYSSKPTNARLHDPDFQNPEGCRQCWPFCLVPYSGKQQQYSNKKICLPT